MSTVVDERLRRLRSELDDHSRIADRLGLDLERPLRSLNDGYPENAVALIGKLTEKLLKELWRHHNIEGDPSTKALNDLVKRCRPHIRSSTVVDALEDIRRLRNRSTHDGYDISDEDGLLAVRRLVDVLVWFTDTGSAALLGGEPDMAPEVARRCEFLAGLYVTLGYRQAKRFVLSPDTVYLLFCRESGMRLEYVELMLSKDADDLGTVLASSGGELLRTRLPKLTRFVILDDVGGGVAAGPLHQMLGADFRIVRYDGFVDTIVNLEAHLAGLASLAPTEPRTAVAAAVMTTDPHTGESKVVQSEDASELLTRLACGSANVLVTGRPGSGKSTLLRSLALSPGIRRFRFYFDLGLKPKDEPFSEYAARLLAPAMASDRSRAYDLFLYLIRSGTALCVLDAVDEGVEEPSPAGFLRLFTDLAAVLSAESAVVMSSRVSFLADSPQVRQLLDSGAGRSEQLVEQMYANGVDPSRVPHFHVVRLAEPGATPWKGASPPNSRCRRISRSRTSSVRTSRGHWPSAGDPIWNNGYPPRSDRPFSPTGRSFHSLTCTGCWGPTPSRTEASVSTRASSPRCCAPPGRITSPSCTRRTRNCWPLGTSPRPSTATRQRTFPAAPSSLSKCVHSLPGRPGARRRTTACYPQGHIWSAPPSGC